MIMNFRIREKRCVPSPPTHVQNIYWYVLSHLPETCNLLIINYVEDRCRESHVELWSHM